MLDHLHEGQSMVVPSPALDLPEQVTTTESVERMVVLDFPARITRPLRVIDITTKDSSGKAIAVTELHMLGDLVTD